MIWKSIPKYEGLYEVSSLGEVRSIERYTTNTNGVKRFFPGRIIKPNKQINGYFGIRLSKNGIIKRFLLHRLVMISFYGANDLDVNHIDFDKSNNSLLNLEWSTKSQNSKHAYNAGRLYSPEFEKHMKSKKAVILEKDGISTYFPSLREAQRQLNLKNLSKVLNGIYKQDKGYTIRIDDQHQVNL